MVLNSASLCLYMSGSLPPQDISMRMATNMGQRLYTNCYGGSTLLDKRGSDGTENHPGCAFFGGLSVSSLTTSFAVIPPPNFDLFSFSARVIRRAKRSAGRALRGTKRFLNTMPACEGGCLGGAVSSTSDASATLSKSDPDLGAFDFFGEYM
jgi:hypothetical protein